MRVLALGLVVLVACVEHPLVVAPVERFEPPPMYEELFEEMQECSGTQLGGGFEIVRFFETEGIWFESGDWFSHGGAWVRPTDVFLRPDRKDDPFTVGHELVHVIRQTTDHDDPAFEACGVASR